MEDVKLIQIHTSHLLLPHPSLGHFQELALPAPGPISHASRDVVDEEGKAARVREVRRLDSLGPHLFLWRHGIAPTLFEFVR